MLFLTEADVRALLPMAKAIELMRGTFARLKTGEARNQSRRRLVLPTGTVLHQMAGADGRYFGTKIYSTHRKHGAHFLFVLYDAATGRPLALLEANGLGQIRTGAASGYATDRLAAPDAATVAVIGSGFQARTQLEAVCAVRKVREARVWSRSGDLRRQFAADMAAVGIAVTPAETARDAVRGAAVVITATNARDPVVEDSWIGAGVHINAMGSNQADRRELPGELVRRADLIVVDSLEQSRIESGDLLLALDEADWGRVVELQSVAGRPSGAPVTIFKSNGLGVEDVTAGAYVYERALAEGRGTDLPVLAYS